MTEALPESSGIPRTYPISELVTRLGRARSTVRHLLNNYEAATGEVIPRLPHPNGPARQVNERQFEILRQVVFLRGQNPSRHQVDLIRELAGVTPVADEPNPHDPAYLLHVMNQIGEQVMQLTEQLDEQRAQPASDVAALRAEVAQLKQQVADLPRLVRADLRELLLETP